MCGCCVVRVGVASCCQCLRWIAAQRLCSAPTLQPAAAMDDDEDDFNPGDDDLEAMLALQEQEEALRQGLWDGPDVLHKPAA